VGHLFHSDQLSRWLDALAAEIKPHLDHGLVEEGLRKIADKFASPEHVGPKLVADFEDIQDDEERAIRVFSGSLPNCEKDGFVL
jgi:hypothetical protein